MSHSTVEHLERAGATRLLLRTWRARGEASAALALVHGYAEHSGRYEHVGAQLAARGIAVWATDLRGHGESSGERASSARIEDLVEDAAVAVEQACDGTPGRPCFLLGHSMGGLVATRLFLDVQKDLRGLVLSGPALGDPAGLEALLALESLPDVVLSSDLLATDPAVGQAYDADPLNYRGPFRRETLAALAQGARDVRARWSEIARPLLVLHGGDDAIVPPLSSEELFHAAASRDKELTVYPGLRHEILNEPAGPEIVDRIAAWIEKRI